MNADDRLIEPNTPQPNRPEPSHSAAGLLVGGVLIVLVAAGAAFWGITTRAGALAVVTRETHELAVPAVTVITPQRGAPQEEIVLPGTMQAFTDSPIYARTNGYLKRWYADIGTRVRAGQVLAEIDTPELDQQLLQARADVTVVEANARLANTTAERYRDLITTDSVSRQELDNANGNLEARLAAVESARANVKRLEQLQAFKRIESPIDGVVTIRNVDVGALIDPGGNAKELFHVASTRRLRVFVSVPEIYSRVAQAGLAADLTLKEFPGRRFIGTLSRSSQAIEVASRTMLTEFDVDNAKGELLPGSYAEVHLKLATQAASLKLPVNVLIFRADGLQVATVKNGHEVALNRITVGRDYGTDVEVIAGLTDDDLVIVNPPDSLVPGQTVRVVPGAKR